MATERPLRLITILTFLPAFPLCLAHGIVSHKPVPAVGLVPLFFSSGFGLFILLRGRKKRNDAGAEERGEQHESTEPTPPDNGASPHRLLLFSVDTILAAALMVVLAFTWIRTSYRADMAMLAAYATIPLLVNFSIHFYLAVREFYVGLALHDLMQYVAWQAVPPNCPDCGHRLRPESAPSIPWVESFPRVQRPAMPKLKMPKAPEWKTPKWLKGRRGGEAPASLFVGAEQAEGPEPYRDYPEQGGEASTRVEEPPEVAVVGKKDKKSKDQVGGLGSDSEQWQA